MLIQPHQVQSPRFIVLEGVNGAGKTTLQKRLSDYLKNHGHHTVCTREPGGTEIGKGIRSLVLGSGKGKICDRGEMFLFAADRSQHVEEVIRPAVDAGKVVICDRYFYSTMAFQGYGRGISTDLIWEINKIAVGGVLPDLILVLDLDPQTGLNRNKKGSDGKDGPDSFEEEELAFHTRIRDGFLEIAKKRPENFLVIDANGSPDDVWNVTKNSIDIMYGFKK
jgi:dTMP kinase